MNSDLAKKLVKISRARSTNRWMRAAQRPISTAVPIFMRKVGLQRRKDIPTFWGGSFLGVLPEAVSTMIWRDGYLDRDVALSLLHCLKPSSTFVDIGAHFGFFSLLGSHLVGPEGRVISVEAMPSTFAHLSENIAKNAAFKHHSLIQKAAFNEQKTLEFMDYGLVASSLNSAFGIRGDESIVTQAEPVAVAADRMDDILSQAGVQKVDLLKIDAESSEVYVLQGLEETLRRDRPAIIMEAGGEGEAETGSLIDVMNKYGYLPHYWTLDGDLRPFDQRKIEYANLLFLTSN